MPDGAIAIEIGYCSAGAVPLEAKTPVAAFSVYTDTWAGEFVTELAGRMHVKQRFSSVMRRH